jgi:long-chain acyl-CoA synthetase
MSSPKFQNLVEMFERSVEKYGPRELFGTKVDGEWKWTTYSEMGKLVADLRGGLAALGIKRGENVCIVSNNRVEWAALAYACFGLGVGIVPMYEAQLPKEWAFIANDCGAVAFVAATKEIAAKADEVKAKAPSIRYVITLYGGESDPMSFKGLLKAGANNPVPSIKPERDDAASLIYTSGTTGNPKGVILSHHNLASNITAVHEILPMTKEERSLSFLPWAHSFGHTCELHAMLSLGASMALCEGVDKIIQNLAEVRPTVLMSVPRIFNRIYDGVNKQMAARPKIIQNLFVSGVRAATKQNKGEKIGMIEKATLALADKIVFTKIRARFGGRLKYAFSGGAALSKEVAQFIDALGIVVYEGYGLTETSPIATANRPGARKIGSVGKAIPGVRIVIDTSQTGDDKQGEIVVYGPNIMQGYHNRDEENKAVFTEDRGFRTGDLGYLDDEGYLYITGRIKEQYKLENGKYVSPAPLEEQLKLSPFIANSMIYGDNRLYNVALVVPDMEALKGWAAEQGIDAGDTGKLLADKRVKELIMSEVDKHSGAFKGFERIKKVTLTGEDFTMDSGLLTPSLKLKRRVAWQKFGPAIEALYSEEGNKNEAGASA